MLENEISYCLPRTGPVKWNSNQETSMLQDSSRFSSLFETTTDVATLTERARAVYHECLWLPEVIMPLNLLVPRLRRLPQSEPSSSGSSPHRLHSALDEILLTSRWCTYKHQNLLSVEMSHDSIEKQIKEWAVDRALLGDDDSRDANQFNSESEKREVQIQILLHMLKLSLPGPCSVPAPRELPDTPASKKLRTQTPSDDDEETPHSILEYRLEGLADRLMVWQMMLPPSEATIDDEQSISKPLRDWTQSFCDDIVQPEFSRLLPEMYHMLRAKLFRLPQWTDEEEEAEIHTNRSLSRATSSTSRLDTHPFFQQGAKSTAEKRSHARTLSRSRSRSLSLSLAQEAQEAEARRTSSTKSKRALDREWSMSRSFKSKDRAPAPRDAESTRSTQQPVMGETQAESPVVFVQGTPVKPRKRHRREE